MKRTPLGRGKPLARGKPLERGQRQMRGSAHLVRGKRLAARSDKRIDEDEEWRDVKMFVTARDGGHCQAERLVPEVACGGRIDPHHVWPTGRGGPRLDPDNVKSLCRNHHDWVHQQQPRLARQRGLLRSA